MRERRRSASDRRPWRNDRLPSDSQWPRPKAGPVREAASGSATVGTRGVTRRRRALRPDHRGGRRVRHCIVRGQRLGRRGIRPGFIERSAQMAPQGGKPRLGVQAQLGRQAVGEVPSEHGEHEAQKFGIAFLDRRVEQLANVGGEAGIGLRGEAGFVAAGEPRAAERCGPVAAEPTGEPAGPGWRKGRGSARPARTPGRGRACRIAGGGYGAAGLRGSRRAYRISGIGCGVAGLRDSRRAQSAGESDAAGNETAHGAADPADEARTNPLVILGKAGGVGCDWHRAGIIHRISLLSRHNAISVEFFLEAGLQTLWPTRSGAMTTATRSIRSNRPAGCRSAQAGYSSRGLRKSGARRVAPWPRPAPS